MGPGRAARRARRLPSEKWPRTDQNPVSRLARRSAMAGSVAPYQSSAARKLSCSSSSRSRPARPGGARRAAEILGQRPEHRRVGRSHPSAPADRRVVRRRTRGRSPASRSAARPRMSSRKPQQALVDQFLQRVQHRHAEAQRAGADRLDVIQADAAAEHRARRQQPPCRLAQQIVAPGDRGAQRPLPVRHVPAAAHQQSERVREPRQDRRRRQQLHPRRRQLDRQRQPVESFARFPRWPRRSRP